SARGMAPVFRAARTRIPRGEEWVSASQAGARTRGRWRSQATPRRARTIRVAPRPGRRERAPRRDRRCPTRVRDPRAPLRALSAWGRGVRTWDTQPFAQEGQRGEITAVGRARRGAGQRSDFVKSKSAPEVGNEHFTLIEGEILQGRRRRGRVET